MLDAEYVAKFRAYERSLQTGPQNERISQIANRFLDAMYPLVLELRPTREEWTALTDLIAGMDVVQARLMLWLLGLTQLVEEGNANMSPEATQIGVEGPFFLTDAPEVEYGGSLATNAGADTPWLVLEGEVRDLSGNPLPNAELHLWAADEDGAYSNFDPGVPEWESRGRIRTNSDGRYNVKMPMPESYAIPGIGAEYLRAVGRQVMRPKHVHFMIDHPGYEQLIMQVCFEGDPYVHIDAALAVRDDHIIPIAQVSDPASLAAQKMDGPFQHGTYDFKLQPVATKQGA